MLYGNWSTAYVLTVVPGIIAIVSVSVSRRLLRIGVHRPIEDMFNSIGISL